MTRYPANRLCPITGEPAARVLAYVSAKAVAASNQTYRSDYAEILGISPDDEFPFVEGPGGFIYSGWSPPDDFLRCVYEDVIDHEQSVTTTIQYRQMLLEFAAAFLRLIGPLPEGRPPLRLLDFGCGYGALLQLLASRDIVSLGYEPSAERRRKTTADGRFPVLTDPQDLSAEAPFDLLVCTEVLEHVPDPRAMLRLLRSLAAPEAWLAITVPHCEADDMAAAFASLKAGEGLHRAINPWEHLNYFSAEDLRRLLREEGFEVVEDHGAAQFVREAADRAGRPASASERALNALRLGRRALSPAATTQLFCRCV